MKSHIHPVAKSMKYALSGIKVAFLEEPNLRIHFFFALLALVFGVIFKINETEWIALVITISIVVILELLNTSLEALTDLASPSIHPKAKLSKDVAAGAVLLAALMSILIGAIIFVPKVLPIFGHLLY